MPKAANTIKKGKTWHGLIKNRRKDGNSYHVLSDIAPIYYKNGHHKMMPVFLGFLFFTFISHVNVVSITIQKRLSFFVNQLYFSAKLDNSHLYNSQDVTRRPEIYLSSSSIIFIICSFNLSRNWVLLFFLFLISKNIR